MITQSLKWSGYVACALMFFVAPVAHAEVFSVNELVGPSGNDNGVDRQLTETDVKGAYQLEPTSFVFKPLLNYHIDDESKMPDLHLGQKNVPFAEVKFTLDRDAKIVEMYLIARTGGSELEAPWQRLKELTITDGKKVIGKVDASKKSNWQKSPQNLRGLGYYFITFKNMKMDIPGNKSVKLTVNASVQKKIKQAVIDANRSSFSPGLLSSISFYFPEMNGITLQTSQGKMLLNTINRAVIRDKNGNTISNADIFITTIPKKK